MRLSQRLEKIIEMAGRGDGAADVGCDHGFVSIELVRRGLYDHVIAMDVRKDPLGQAKEHIASADLGEKIETRLGDGLEKLEISEAETIIIAGMGGHLMADILDREMEIAKSAKRLILSPQSDLGFFREYLINHGFAILREAMLKEDGKYYLILEVSPGHSRGWNEDELRYGRLLIEAKDGILIDKLEREIATSEGLIARLSEAKSEGSRQRILELRRDLASAGRALMRCGR